MGKGSYHSVHGLNRTISNKSTVTSFELKHEKAPKATKGIYVGESDNQKASRIFVEATGRTHVTRHVKVYENFPYWTKTEENIPAPTANIRSKTPEPMELNQTIIASTAPKFPTSETDTKLPTILRRSETGRIPKKNWNIVENNEQFKGREKNT